MSSEATRRRHRRKQLLSQLYLHSELACESHKVHDADKHTEKVLELAIELLRVQPTQDRVKTLVKILQECAIEESYVHWEVDKGHLHVKGSFVLDELAERIVWGSKQS